MTIPNVRYVVLDEHTLGFIDPRQPAWMQVLHGSVLKGGRDWKNGSVPLGLLDRIRDATLADFDAYRVSSKGHMDD